ncbi:LemA family protein [Solemya velum gill symbiont]|uniref:LemA family protein n=1 Tax=Solemya velum gill symbiont TaxID=2340 RepID=UPI00227F1958|nr:LemA family protein [Solemya velum gill symbiont]
MTHYHGGYHTYPFNREFQKRTDLVPNMLKAAKKYMEHEKELLSEIVELRSSANVSYDKSDPQQVGKHIDAENMLKSKLDALKITVENYPDLKSDATMLDAMDSMENVENNLSAARRFYNSAVGDLNNTVEIFPSSFFANWLNIRQMPFFEAEESARKSVDASDYL